MLTKRGIFMCIYSIIPASITTNIKHGTCIVTDDEKIELSFDIYQNPDEDLVYKACVCSIENDFSTINLGTIMTKNSTCSLSGNKSFDTDNSVIVIYLKNTKTSEVTFEGYCVLNDKPVLDIKATENDAGMFNVECVFEYDETSTDDEDSLDNAEKVLDDYKELHPPSDASMQINKKYFHKILSELENFEPFVWGNNEFSWYKITTFTVPGNLSSVKYVLFDTLSINAFDTHKHYLFGINKESDDESYYIAIALPSKANPINHLNDYANKIPYNENYDYFVAYIELAPDGQYFLKFDNEI